MKITYEKVVLSVMAGYLLFASIWGFTFRNEYRSDRERTDKERAIYLELSQRQLDAIHRAESGVGELSQINGEFREEVRSIGSGVDDIKQGLRDSGDGIVGIGITSDRSIRLLNELQTRFGESQE